MRYLRALSCISVTLGLLSLMACRERHDKTEISYGFNLSARQALAFKSDLKDFAVQNNYDFIDGSAKTKAAREYVNKESERSSRNVDLATQGGELIDVSVESTDPKVEFLLFAKTSAYDTNRVSLTMIYDQTSSVESAMADNFSRSEFLSNWKNFESR